MSDSVPFDPPYVTKVNGEDGSRWVEVLEDGSVVPCDAPSTWPWHSTQTAVAAPAANRSKKPQVTLLKVPYAEKDEAKSLGAKWDPARKKWYVPQGVDAEPFSRWAIGD